MTDEQRAALERRIKEHTQAIAKDADAARASMIRMGIITHDGRLAPDYQVEGEPKKDIGSA